MIHVPNIPAVPLIWFENWKPGRPDIWTASKRYLSGVVVHEMEVSNASFVRGGTGNVAFATTVEVDNPRGYVLVEDCARPLPFVWYTMHATMRRFALYPKDRPDLRPEAERLARMQYDTTKWRRGRLAYGPCNIPLPNLSTNQAAQEAFKVSGWLAHLRQILTSPVGLTGAVEDSQDGIFIRLDGWTPWGIPERFAQGGSGIFFYTGWEQSPDMPAYLWLAACCNHERRWHAYERDTGRVITADSYGDPGPMYQEGSQTQNNRWLPEYQTVAAWPDPLPLPYDPAHSIRGFRHLVALSEMVDSRAVLRMLRSQAAHFRLQNSEIGPYPQASGYVPPSLRNDIASVVNRQNRGYWGQDTGRQHGWPAFLIAQSIKKGAVENRAWAEDFCTFASYAAMPSGIISRCRATNPLDVWYDQANDTAQAFEVPIFWHGGVGCATQTGDPGFFRTQVDDFARSLYIDAPLYPYYSGHGPPHFAYVAERDGDPYPTITGGKVSGGGDSTHAHAGCALAAHLDPANRQLWIDRALNIEPVSDFRESAGLVAQEQR